VQTRTKIISGLFFVIEGFLDIVLPIEGRSLSRNEPKPRVPSSSVESLYDIETTSSNGDSNISSVGSPREPSKPSAPSASRPGSSTKGQRPLFTVKPGGIAGYLGKITRLMVYAVCLQIITVASLSNAASYVDIVAKTDTYVGFLPHHALQRLLEKRPIVLLTLAKRLISLLSPLGQCFAILKASLSELNLHRNQSYRLTRPWTGCTLAQAKSCGVLTMPVIVSTSLSMGDYVP